MAAPRVRRGDLPLPVTAASELDRNWRLFHTQDHVVRRERRTQCANDFAQAAAQATAIDRTGRVLRPMT